MAAKGEGLTWGWLLKMWGFQCGDEKMLAPEWCWLRGTQATSAMGRGGVGGDPFTFPVHCQPGIASSPKSSRVSLPGAMATGVYYPAQLEIGVFKERKEQIKCGAENTAELVGCLPGIHRAVGPISQYHATQLWWQITEAGGLEFKVILGGNPGQHVRLYL